MISTLSLGDGPGGVQSIQISLFEYFSNIGETCKLFDTKEGWVYSELTKRKIKFVFVEIDKIRSNKDYSRFLSKDDLLIVFNGNFFENLLLFSKSECKVLFWEVYYPWIYRFIYTRYFPVKFLAQSQELRILSKLTQGDAIYFIDYLGKKAVEERLKISISSNQYLPIPIKVTNCKPPHLKDKIVVTYIGRAVNWKIKPLNKVLLDILEINYQNKIQLNIVTDNVELFRETISNIVDLKEFFVEFYENMNESELTKLLEKTNLNIGMGTAALDGSKIGIPTILIDPSEYDLPFNYRYRWIFETNELILGKMLNVNETKFDGTHTLIEIFNTLQESYAKIANNCYTYVYSNYNIDNIADKIKSYRLHASLKMNAFDKLFINMYNRMLRTLSIK